MRHLLKICCITALALLSFTAYAQIAYDITWYYAGTKYRSLLVPQNDDDWFCRVRYVSNGYVRMIDQSMTPTVYDDGIVLHGCCPVYAGTTTSCSTYSADNLAVLTNGTVYSYDANGRSPVYSVTPIYSNQTYNRLWNTTFRQ